MAYLIRVLDNADPFMAANEIESAMQKDGRFRSLRVGVTMAYWKRQSLSVIDMGKIRLTKSKPYCGQHPGECLIGGTRRNSTCLEWDDWVAFHALINDVLDKLGVSADVTTKPMENVAKVKGLKGLFWIRKGKARRLRYEWDERTSTGTFGRTVRIWNPGTEDQFTAAQP